MCICYYSDIPLALVWSKRKGTWVEIDATPFQNRIYPGMQGAIVVSTQDRRELVPAQWGMIPFWAKDAKYGRSSGYNARSETLLEKPTWRQAVQQRRCIVPVRAFYERDNGRWLRFARPDGDLMPVAGLFEEPNKHSEVRTYALVTTDPNEVVSPVHDRMPVVLSDSDTERWLDSGAEINEIRGMLVPSDPASLQIGDAGPIRKPGELKGLPEEF